MLPGRPVAAVREQWKGHRVLSRGSGMLFGRWLLRGDVLWRTGRRCVLLRERGGLWRRLLRCGLRNLLW